MVKLHRCSKSSQLPPPSTQLHQAGEGRWNLKLGGMGLAATASEPLSLVCGNIFYMAPEMIAETGLVAMTSHIMVVFVHEDWGCDFFCAQLWYQAGRMGCWCCMLHSSLWNYAIWKVMSVHGHTLCNLLRFSFYSTVTVRELQCPTSRRVGMPSSLHSGTMSRIKPRYAQLRNTDIVMIAYTFWCPGLCVSSAGGISMPAVHGHTDAPAPLAGKSTQLWAYSTSYTAASNLQGKIFRFADYYSHNANVPALKSV